MGFVMLFALLVAPIRLWAEAEQPVKKILVIPVSDHIDSGLSFFIQRMIRRAEQENAVLLLEINSNGGLVTAAQEIKDALLRSDATTIAYIKGRALSAAALVAISCHRIYMEPGSQMGAATPIMLMGGSVKAAEAKFVSAFRAEFKGAAEARKRPTALAEAMVDEKHDGIDGLLAPGKILTLSTEDAFKHGYCDFIVSDISTVQRILKLENAEIEISEPTSAEWLARFLTNPNVSVLLFTVGFWCLVLEFFIAGFGVLGITGITCLVLFFGGHMFAYLAGLEAILLFAAGIILLLIELLVIPGFGVTGVSGILAICFSIIIVFGGIYSAVHAITAMLAYSFVIMMITWYAAPKFKFFDFFILKNEMSTDDGYISADQNAFDDLIGLEGVAMSACRPSGKAKIGDNFYDVVSDGNFVDKGARITVKKVQGTKIFVRPLSE